MSSPIAITLQNYGICKLLCEANIFQILSIFELLWCIKRGWNKGPNKEHFQIVVFKQNPIHIYALNNTSTSNVGTNFTHETRRPIIIPSVILWNLLFFSLLFDTRLLATCFGQVIQVCWEQRDPKGSKEWIPNLFDNVSQKSTLNPLSVNSIYLFTYVKFLNEPVYHQYFLTSLFF